MEVYIGVYSWVCHPNIDGATAHSDNTDMLCDVHNRVNNRCQISTKFF